jgi:uracil-DNA glycosylase
MKKILFVGQAPSRDTEGGPPFSGRSGRRLASLCGLAHSDLPKMFDLANLLDRWPGKAGKGDAFPLEEARAGAARLDLSGRPLVVLVGRNVARAFGAGGAAYFEPISLQHVSAVGADVKYNPRRVAWQSADRPSPTVLQGGQSGGAAGLVQVERVPAVVVPHPSGVNRWWNCPENEARAKEFLTSLLPGPRTASPPTSDR